MLFRSFLIMGFGYAQEFFLNSCHCFVKGLNLQCIARKMERDGSSAMQSDWITKAAL